jgi:hypothetical protein
VQGRRVLAGHRLVSDPTRPYVLTAYDRLFLKLNRIAIGLKLARSGSVDSGADDERRRPSRLGT